MSFISFKTLNSLEEFSFIAGNTYTLEFEVFEEDGVTPLDLGGATVDWVLCPYGQPDFTVLHIVGTITATNKFKIELSATNTETFFGKYIQQPIITSFGGSEYRPAQGICLILPRIELT